jgi:nitronate monooxygenase
MVRLRSALCEILRIEIPIIQAPMGVATPALVAAVSNAGGLGMLGTGNLRSTDEIRAAIVETRGLTDRPFGANLILRGQPDVAERLAACLDERVSVISFFWEDPAGYIERVHEAGSLVTYTVASAEDARRAVRAGVDIVVTQGWEAGGHVRGQVASLPLIPRVVDAVRPTPVVAAGGIADGRGMAAAMALGAAGVWMGTRFLLSDEASTHPVHRELIRRAEETDTVYTGVFDLGWPGAPHRALRNSTIREWEAAGRPPSGQRPGEAEVLGRSPQGEPVVRYRSLTPTVDTTGNVEAMSLYAGQSAGLVTESGPAGDIVRDVAEEAIRVLQRCAALVEN